jgi:DNA (cytosine-5)-methyltransferase 1
LKVLDLFCGIGGAGKGYADAGHDVTGVDIVDQPDYPNEFIQGDALVYLLNHGKEYDFVHASPPCQFHSALTKGTNFGKQYPDLIPQTRMLLRGMDYVIENVAGATIRKDFMLCGEMFGLSVLRHRFFETNLNLTAPEHPKHRGRVRGWRHGEYFDGPYIAVYGKGGGKGTVPEWKDAMEIDWSDSRKGIAEAIPPAYTKFIGENI